MGVVSLIHYFRRWYIVLNIHFAVIFLLSSASMIHFTATTHLLENCFTFLAAQLFYNSCYKGQEHLLKALVLSFFFPYNNTDAGESSY